MIRSPAEMTALAASSTDMDSSMMSDFGKYIRKPVVGFGVFLMTQRQMVGIRDRAETLARSRRAEATEVVEATPLSRAASDLAGSVMS